MGILRFLLALSVLVAHSHPIKGIEFVGSELAVETFFIISGFYISMVLNEKYVNVKNPYWLFISNRALKLYPMYYLVLILTLVCAKFVPQYDLTTYANNLNAYNKYGHSMTAFSWLFALGANAIIFFQDIFLFLGFNPGTGSFYFTHNFKNETVKGWEFAMVVQAWSIALELMFYLLAPFIVRRKPWIIGVILLASLGFKLFGASQGYEGDPWSYRFFPFELGYFLIGTFSYFGYKNYVRRMHLSKIVGITIYFSVAIITIFYKQLSFNYSAPLYIMFIALAIPFLFQYTKGIKFDREIAELSYPMYLTHILVFNVISALHIWLYPDVLNFVGTIVFSYILNRLLGNTLEKFRQRRVVTN